jgi:hypothetical protein
MGFNFGLVCVRATDPAVTQDRVAELIDAYWTERGATRRKKGFLAVEPMTVEDGGDELSFAVSPITDEWIVIADSERYTACEPLAKHLSKELAAEVIHFEVTEVANAAFYTHFKAGEELAKNDDEDASGYSAAMDFLDGVDLPYFGLYFDQMSKKEWTEGGFRVFGYRDVSDDDYFGGGDEDDEPEETPEEKAAREAAQLAEHTRTADLAWELFRELASAPGVENRDLSRQLRLVSGERMEDRWYGDIDELAHLQREVRRHDRLLELADTLERFDSRVARDDDQHELRADALLGLARFDEATPHVLHVLFAHADTVRSYDRLAYLYAQTGRRKDAAALAAARRTLEAEGELYTDNREDWRIAELEAAAAQDLASARTTIACALRDEVDAIALEEHGRRRLEAFLELSNRLGDPAELATLASRVRAETARRDAAFARVETAAKRDRAKVRRALTELPPGDKASELCELLVDDVGVRYELLLHAVRGGRDVALADLLSAAVALGDVSEVTPLIPLARRRARFDAGIYHPAAAVALAAGRRDLALELCRHAVDACCPTLLEMPGDPALAALHTDPAFRAMFDDALVRPIRTTGDGEERVLVREHLIVAFFVPGSLGRLAERLAPKLERVLDAFLEFVPGDALAHGLVGVHATRGDDTRPFDDKLLGRARKQLDPARLAKNADAHFELWGPDDDNAAFHFEIGGDADEDDANHVEMRFPPEFVDDVGIDAFRAWIEMVSTYLPYAYGFATRALTPSDFYSSSPTMHAHLAALAQWHAGLDIIEMVELRLWLGDKVPGAKWLSFLDGKKLRRVGGFDHLVRTLAPHGVRVAALANGTVLQAGAAPDRGRGKQFANREQLRRVHAALAPITRLTWNLNGGLDRYPGGVEAWLRRYLDDLAITPPPNPILSSRSSRPGL